MRSVTASALCILALNLGCSQDTSWRAVNEMIAANYPDVSTISTDSLASWRADSTRAQPLLLDARSPEEFAVSHLPGAQRVDPDARSFPDLDAVPQDTPIVVYCSVGYRSARVSSRLQKQGFTQVANLKGSIFRWANEGRPVVRRGGRVEAVHPFDRTWGTLLVDSLHAYAPTE